METTASSETSVFIYTITHIVISHSTLCPISKVYKLVILLISVARLQGAKGFRRH